MSSVGQQVRPGSSLCLDGHPIWWQDLDLPEAIIDPERLPSLDTEVIERRSNEIRFTTGKLDSPLKHMHFLTSIADTRSGRFNQ